MNYSEKYLKAHPLYEHMTFQEHCERIPEFYFRKDVPDDVVKNFEIVERLLVHSYFEYRFIDEALSKALYTFEMAMKIRCKELNHNMEGLMFNKLIHYLSALNYFDTDIEALKSLKEIRNDFSHPERHSFGGFAYWHRIEWISRIINEMYEDKELRAERKEAAVIFNEKQNNANLNELLVMHEDNQMIPLSTMRLIFINNKHIPPVYLLVYTYLFNIENESDRSLKVPYVDSIKIINPVFNDDTLVAEDYDNKKTVRFTPARHHNDALFNFNKWNKEYNTSIHNVLYKAGISFHIPNILVPEIQSFQKM